MANLICGYCGKIMVENVTRKTLETKYIQCPYCMTIQETDECKLK